VEHIEDLGTHPFTEVKDAEQDVCGLDLLTGPNRRREPLPPRPASPVAERDGSGRSVPSFAHDLSDMVKDRIS